MRKRAVWGVTAILVLAGAAAGVRAADADSGESKAGQSESSWWNPFDHWPWSKEKKPEPKKMSSKPAKQAPSKPAAATKPVTVVGEAVAERAREEEILLRRLQACDRLQEMAIQSKDEALLRQAEEMGERAWTLYGQHTVYLRTGAVELGAEEMDAGSANSGKTARPNGLNRTTAGTGRDVRAARKEVEQ